MPWIKKCIELLGEAMMIFTFDANSGCWQVDINKKDKDEATFTSNLRLYRFMCMSFGSNDDQKCSKEPETSSCQRQKMESVMVYLNEVFIYSAPMQNPQHVRNILTLLQEAGVPLKCNK